MEAIPNVHHDNDNHVNIARLLLAHEQIHINQQNTRGVSALHRACLKLSDSTAGIRLLLSDTRCDVTLQDDCGYTALMHAVEKLNVQHVTTNVRKVIEMLLIHPRKNGVNCLNRNNESALLLFLK